MTIPDAVKLARYDALAETVEKLHDECMTLRQAISQTLNDNGHLADGEVCTLIVLKQALRQLGTPWEGDELREVAQPPMVSAEQLAKWLNEQKPMPPEMAKILHENLWDLYEK